MHTVKRAIIMAAGVGNRMRPLTLTVPKPLVKVQGQAMIESVIEALHQNGITEIHVVVGHLKDQFEYLPEKYRGLSLIENPYYESCNNISSLYVAREWLDDCMILDGDQIIYNPDILSPRFSRSGYNAVWCEGETREWLMDVQDGIVRACSRTGGSKGWQLYSISRWSAKDGALLRCQIEKEFQAGNHQIYWDDVPMFLYFHAYELGIWPMKAEDIIEIDGLEELIRMDSTYKTYKNDMYYTED